MVRQERSDAPPPPFEDVDHAALRDLFESQRVRRWAVEPGTADALWDLSERMTGVEFAPRGCPW